MRALLSKSTGGPDSLEMTEIANPVAGPDELLINVKACSINFPDFLIIQDMYQVKPERPFAPGSEVAGVIEAVGENVQGWSVGDRIIACTGYGGLVEKLVIPASSAIKLPDQFSYQQGASLLMTYGTSIHALKDRGHIQTGDVVLVLGAAGGVGLSAVELATAYGAQVIAAVSSQEKADAAKKAGAVDTVIYDRAPFDKAQSKALAQKFKEIVPAKRC